MYRRTVCVRVHVHTIFYKYTQGEPSLNHHRFRHICPNNMTKLNMSIVFFLFFAIITCARACDRCVHESKAAFFSNDSPLSSGACGYGSLAPDFNGGYLASAGPSLYRNGSGCGACYQIRCKNRDLCTTSGTKVILFDHNTDSQVGFVLSRKAFKAMANPGKDQDVLRLGITDIEYKWIPCDYKDKKLAIRVEESSYNPGYLAIKVLYIGGQTEIKRIDVAKVGTPNYNTMNRNYGAVWDTSNAPNGPLDFRFLITSGFGGSYISAQNVLPANWKPGQIYYTQHQITAIAQEACSPCDSSTWD